MDLIVEVADQLIPFEVKYQSQTVNVNDAAALIEFCQRKSAMNRGYILTKSAQDIGLLASISAQHMRIPASLFSYGMGESELFQMNLFKSSDQ